MTMEIFNKRNIGGTILERARSVQLKPTIKKNHITDEEIMLALAWARDEVTVAQVKGAIGSQNTTHVMHKLARWLREAVRRGYLA